MNIAMFLPSLSNTGPGIVVQELCAGLIRYGHFCKVFYFDDVVELEMPCAVEKINFMKRIDLASWDVLHSHMFRPDLYLRLHYWNKKSKAVFVTTLHNPISYDAIRTGFGVVDSLVLTLLWQLSLTVFDKVVVLNDTTCSLLKGVGKDKFSVIFNGRSLSEKKEVSNVLDIELINSLRSKYKIIGTVSGITSRKGLEQMVNALTLLPDYAFVAVGDGPELNNLKMLTKKLEVDERCYWLGFKKDAVSYFSLFDLFVMCSRSEGFPLALIEAARYAKPTVLSNIPILTSIITENEVAFYELDNILSLARMIRKVTDNANDYSDNIYKYYKDKLTSDVMTSKYIELYKAILCEYK